MNRFKLLTLLTVRRSPSPGAGGRRRFGDRR